MSRRFLISILFVTALLLCQTSLSPSNQKTPRPEVAYVLTGFMIHNMNAWVTGQTTIYPAPLMSHSSPVLSIAQPQTETTKTMITSSLLHAEKSSALTEPPAISSTTTTTSMPSPTLGTQEYSTSTAQGDIGTPTAYQREMWEHVHECEGDPWNDDGPKYFGGLGWLAATWNKFRTPGDPISMAAASIAEQISAGVAFSEFYYGYPDGDPEPSLSTCGKGY